ncbi:MAG: hypothetical protein N2235_02790 [Fischerella sp.]|nr:hypothetical protein [Fischerella sp.]
MGHGAWGKGHQHNFQYPIANAQFPIPNPLFPTQIKNTQFYGLFVNKHQWEDEDTCVGEICFPTVESY